MSDEPLQFDDAEREAARRLLRVSIQEDRAHEDVTSVLAVEPDMRGTFELRNRKPGVLAGIEAVALTLEAFDADARVEVLAPDGTSCETPRALARIEGRRRDVLATERTFLNMIGVLSGTATLTHRFVEAATASCAILDTRKTWPGYRLLQKYAVRCGGGRNHRPNLAGGILLKDNHRHEDLDLDQLVNKARLLHAGLELVVEVDDEVQLEKALRLGVDRVLLDNFDASRVAHARTLRDAVGPDVKLEVSGGVTLDTVGELARAGADFASVGALTHSAAAWDVGLDERSGD